MSPEAELFLQKAARLLGETKTMLEAGLFDAVGRNAYLGAFHAAQSLIFERSGKVMKTHAGVQSEFLRLTRNDPGISASLRAFLSKAYDFKTIADYETEPSIGLSENRAAEAMAEAHRFVAAVAALMR